jgi:hypothetical protein
LVIAFPGKCFHICRTLVNLPGDLKAIRRLHAGQMAHAAATGADYVMGLMSPARNEAGPDN